MTQAELGAMIGCSNNHVSHIETGQTRVSNAVLMRIARTMEMSLDYFLLDTHTHSPKPSSIQKSLKSWDDVNRPPWSPSIKFWIHFWSSRIHL